MIIFVSPRNIDSESGGSYVEFGTSGSSELGEDDTFGNMERGVDDIPTIRSDPDSSPSREEDDEDEDVEVGGR